jgi:predicted PurR-regulated permease PerM
MQKSYPFYLRATIILFGIMLLVFVLHVLKDILVPLSFALLIAILVNPLVNLLVRFKLPKGVAIGLSLTLAFIVIALVAYFLSMEIAGFSDDFPKLEQRLTKLFQNAQQFVKQHWGITFKKQEQYISEAETGLKPLLGSTAGTLISTLATIVLLPVYSFLFLYYKNLLLNFIFEIFSEENATEVQDILRQTKAAIRQYMSGLLIEGLIVATLNTTVLFILGVEYAVLLGILGAILNVLPFIGGILSVALPVLIATITHDGFSTQLWIIVLYMVIQFIDNHFLIPYIVSSKVKINALISIVVVLLGGALWGISGMFLSIPLTGVLKIIFDRIPELQPWGNLLGMEIPVRHKGQLWPRKRRARNSKSN